MRQTLQFWRLALILVGLGILSLWEPDEAARVWARILLAGSEDDDA